MGVCGPETTARRGLSERDGTVLSPSVAAYFPANKSLAMVANCMLDVPS